MSALRDRLRALVDALPSEEASVTLSRADLRELLGDSEGSDQTALARDLTVDDVAAHVGRAPSTVRGWLGQGLLRGYKLNARDWRVPRSALAEYLERQRGDKSEVGRPVDISAWRRVAGTDK